MLYLFAVVKIKKLLGEILTPPKPIKVFPWFSVKLKTFSIDI